MTSCNQFKRAIDEADRPDLLSYEAADHISSCADCRIFAEEREGLRRLLASSGKVTVPVNFNAVLGEKLAAVKERGSFSWLSPAGFLRLGAATAALVVAIFVFQPWSSHRYERSEYLAHQNGTRSQLKPVAPTTDSTASELSASPPSTRRTTVKDDIENYRPAVRRFDSRRDVINTGREFREPDFVARDPQIVIIRGHNGESEVFVPTVSVGAQPLVLGNASRRSPDIVKTSF